MDTDAEVEDAETEDAVAIDPEMAVEIPMTVIVEGVPANCYFSRHVRTAVTTDQRTQRSTSSLSKSGY